MSNYKNAFTEVWTILNCLDKNELNKIPPEVLDAIEENINLEYYYEIEDYEELKDCPMLPETKALLFNLFRDYLSTSEQKEKIIRMQKEEIQISELKKQQIYNTDVFVNKRKNTIEEMTKEKTELVEYKENIFRKILKKIKRFFSRK